MTDGNKVNVLKTFPKNLGSFQGNKRGYQRTFQGNKEGIRELSKGTRRVLENFPREQGGY